MGRCSRCMDTQINVHLLLSLLLLSSIPLRNSAEGRPAIFKLLEVTKEADDEKMVVVGTTIGSRPPRCKGMCSTCGHCVAVQVPAVPEERSGAGHLLTTITSKGDDSSNYKPMDWKCKCGGMILNP